MRTIVIMFDSASFLLRCALSGAKYALFPVVCAPFLVLGLYELWNPAIPNCKKWRKFGHHGEHGKIQPVELKQSICDSKYSIMLLEENTLFMTQNSLFVNQMTQNNLFPSIYQDR